MDRFIDTLNRFIKEVKIKKKEDLRAYIETFKSMVERYERDFVRTFYEIAEIMPEKDRDSVRKYYSNEFRVRYNEFAAKYDDFLTRATRELGYPLEGTIGRAKEFPK